MTALATERVRREPVTPADAQSVAHLLANLDLEIPAEITMKRAGLGARLQVEVYLPADGAPLESRRNTVTCAALSVGSRALVVRDQIVARWSTREGDVSVWTYHRTPDHLRDAEVEAAIAADRYVEHAMDALRDEQTGDER